MNQNIIYICLIFLIIVNFIITIFQKNKKKIINESNFLISMKILDLTISDYCDSYFIDHINKMKKKYDLNEESQTQSINQFKKEYTQNLNDTIKIIINQYLSPDIRDELLFYFSIDSLILYIINQIELKVGN